jgi:hypothetical protein
MSVVRVHLPGHLRRLAQVDGEAAVEVAEPTLRAVLDAVESAYPVLRGTIRDQVSGDRRAFVRFFGCEEDLSHEPMDAPLPEPIASGREALLVVGAMAGG